MPTFRFVKSEPITVGNTKSLDEARVAVAKQVELVEAGKTTARQAMAWLLNTYPVLKKERRGGGQHALSPLVDYYVAEVFS